MVNLMRISLLFIDNCFAPFAPGHQNHIRKKAPHASCVSRLWLEVPPRFELGNKGFADLCLTTWPWHHTLILWKRRSKYYILSVLSINGADDEARTRYLHLGKVALYQMSYVRIWCLRSESNQWHGDFQSPALPTELQRRTGRWLLYLKFRFCKGVNPNFFQ